MLQKKEAIIALLLNSQDKQSLNTELTKLIPSRSITSCLMRGIICKVKTELRHREWAEQIQECQSSGKTVTAWCKEKGISQHTYYSRLNVVRKELLKRAKLPLQQIVPLSVSQSVTCTTATVQTQCILLL